jgi:flagellar hook-associated protein 1 FlgK
MSLYGLFDIGKSAIFASQAALNITGHNISNANTEGYSRQDAVLETRQPVSGNGYYLGRGVEMVEARRHFDSLLQSQFLAQGQIYGRSSALSKGLVRTEEIFNEITRNGFSDALTGFFNSWEEVANNPEDASMRTVLLDKAQWLVQSAQSMESGMKGIITDSYEGIKDSVSKANAIASEIAQLNQSIVETGGKANDLLDTRDRLLTELSGLVEYQSFETSEGMVNVTVGFASLVAGTTASEMTVTTGQDYIDIHIGSKEVGSRIQNGEIGGLLALGESVRNELLAPFRSLVGSVIDEVNTIHAQGYGLDGSTGMDFFSPSDTSDPETLIWNFSVAVTDPASVAAAQGPGSLPGDNRNALLMGELRLKGAMAGATFDDYYRNMVSVAGSMSRAASDSARFEGALMSDLSRRMDSVSGVSLEEEAVNMVKFQHAFEAGARIIKVTDELLETVINLGRI